MPFRHQPVLKGRLVELRPLRPDDRDALYAVAADPRIWEQHPVKDRHEEAVFDDFFRESLDSGGALLATDAATGRVVGSSRYHGYSEEDSEVEIGWTFLARSHWGGRYNGELKQLMLQHAFRYVASVVLFVSPENLRSRRAVEKIGGVEAPTLDAQGRLVYRIRAPHVPHGWPAVTPRIAVDEPERLVRFVRRVFDATGNYHAQRPSELRIGGSMLMVGDASARGTMPAFLYVYVQDTDATYQRALESGAVSLEEPRETPYGDRRAMVRDPWGNEWQIATHRGRFTPLAPAGPSRS